MEKFKSNFGPTGYPYIIVSKLIDDIIRAAIQEFIDITEDFYWLKLYYITVILTTEDINEILYRNTELEAED